MDNQAKKQIINSLTLIREWMVGIFTILFVIVFYGLFGGLKKLQLKTIPLRYKR